MSKLFLILLIGCPILSYSQINSFQRVQQFPRVFSGRDISRINNPIFSQSNQHEKFRQIYLMVKNQFDDNPVWSNYNTQKEYSIYEIPSSGNRIQQILYDRNQTQFYDNQQPPLRNNNELPPRYYESQSNHNRNNPPLRNELILNNRNSAPTLQDQSITKSMSTNNVISVPQIQNQNREEESEEDDRPVWGDQSPQVPEPVPLNSRISADSSSSKPENINQPRDQFSREYCKQYCNDPSNRPINQQSNPNDYPYLVAIGHGDKDKPELIVWESCVGTLISKLFVLTTASCANSAKNQNPNVVRLGAFSSSGNSQLVKISQVLFHAYYEQGTPWLYHDIALLFMESLVTYSEGIQPACLYDGKEIPLQAMTTVIANQGAFISKIQNLNTNTISNEECKKLIPTNPAIPNGILIFQLCANVTQSGRTDCKGQIGSPLVISNTKTFRPGYRCGNEIIGISSLGKFCREDNAPAVFTRISEYVPWLESIVWPDEIN